MAEIKLIGFVAEMAGTGVLNVHLDQSSRLRDILPTPLPEERIIVLVDQKGGTLDSLIEDGNKVMILPVVSGG